MKKLSWKSYFIIITAVTVFVGMFYVGSSGFFKIMKLLCVISFGMISYLCFLFKAKDNNINTLIGVIYLAMSIFYISSFTSRHSREFWIWFDLFSIFLLIIGLFIAEHKESANK